MRSETLRNHAPLVSVLLALLLAFALVPGSALADGASGASGEAAETLVETGEGEEPGEAAEGAEDDATAEVTEPSGDAAAAPVGTTTSAPVESDADGADATTSADISASISYRVHVQTYGTLGWVTDGATAGTTGESKRMEAIWIQLEDLSNVSGDITYRVHCQTYGWTDWKSGGESAGTTGEGKRLEAVQIALTGGMEQKYDVYYRVHCQTYGWMNWVKNGETAGTTGESKRLEAVEVVLVKKGGAAPKNSSSAGVVDGTPRVEWRVHGQSYGWQGWVSNAAGSANLVLSGTTGTSKRVEAVELRLRGIDGGITYRVHGQSYGWQGWRSDGATAGTTGESKRVEAVQIKLTGNAESRYDVWYRVHCQTYGWLGWAKNGETAGTTGLSKRVEAVEVILLPAGSSAPGATMRTHLTGDACWLNDCPFWNGGTVQVLHMNKHYNGGRAGRSINKVVIHHNAGNFSIRDCWNLWQTRPASAHYQVEADGTVGQLVWDGDTAWHAANRLANQTGIGVEHANVSSHAPWRIPEATLESGAKLVAALCVQYGLGVPRWGVNVFGHSDFYKATACPGELSAGGSQHDRYMERAVYWYYRFLEG